jgi:PBP1b-binding outer membrane lipoprotein LpoB
VRCRNMRITAALTLVGCLLFAPIQSLADGQSDPSEVVDSTADAVDAQPVVDSAPAVTTRTLDPPTSVSPFNEATPQADSEETRVPLDVASDPPQPLPPGPPNRLP